MFLLRNSRSYLFNCSYYFSISVVRCVVTQTDSNYTVGNCLNKWKTRFIESGISEPQQSVEHILAYVLGTKKITDVYENQEKILKSYELQRLQKLCAKRLQKMPVQYIIQEWDFRDMTLKMSRPVFIPRPETEMLVDIVLNEIDGRKKPIEKFLELCCGSGAVSLALLKEKPHLKGVAIDKSLEACNLARENAEIHHMSQRLRIIQGDIEAIDERFDLIISNPPYIPTSQLENLQPEITLYEDRDALDGGTDGLSTIKRILNISSKILEHNGKLYLEVDPSHPTLIKAWLEKHCNLQLRCLRSYKDFYDKERFVEVIKDKLLVEGEC